MEYSVKIVSSSKELTPKEKVMLKDTSDCLKIDEVTDGQALLINPSLWVELEVHNEKSDNKDYPLYLIVDENGEKYVTGSKNFYSSFIDIIEEMAGYTEEEWKIKIYKVPSKNYKGKNFITCSLV